MSVAELRPSALVASDEVNIAHYLPALAKRRPHARAIVVPGPRDKSGRRAYRHLSFFELNELSDRYARGLLDLGIARGTRTILMVRPSLEFFALTFGLFKIGAVPILIDPGMGRKGFLDAVKEAKPEALIGIPLAHALSVVFSGAFSTLKHRVTVGRRLFWGGATLEQIAHSDRSTLPLADTKADEVAAILFTSGSTGPAKGVVYTHGIFDAQTQLIRDEFGIQEGEIDLPAFPLFALFSCALGVTCVIPDMNPSRPAEVDPRLVIEAIRDHGVTYSFGSPAFWTAVGRYASEQGVRFSSLKRVMMAGAPVQPSLVRRFSDLLPKDGDLFIPYGATECLPVSWIRGSHILAETWRLTEEGKGSCVGRPLTVNEARIIRISDQPIETIDSAEILPNNEIGEIIVKGPTVTPAYDGREADTRQAKIRDGDRLWHRMGDVGYLDDTGRLWFCGRKNHRVQTARGTMFTVPCEAIFNVHDRVYRSALVGVDGRPVIIIECEPGKTIASKADESALREELLALAKRSPLTAQIEDVLFHSAFPVDVRHNAKIKRELLAEWAKKALVR